MTPRIVARGKALRLAGGPRLARCESQEIADLLALYAAATAYLAPIAPQDWTSGMALRERITLAEKTLLQTVTLKPLDKTLD